MDFGIRTPSTLKLFNKETGEEVMSIDYNNPVMDIKTDRKYDSKFGICTSSKTEMTLHLEDAELDTETMNLLLGCDSECNNKEYKFNLKAKRVVTTTEQVKKHKNKRINKKWAKRYGYKNKEVEIEIEIPNCKVNKINKDEINFSVLYDNK